jgi:hypothetical protein
MERVVFVEHTLTRLAVPCGPALCVSLKLKQAMTKKKAIQLEN